MKDLHENIAKASLKKIDRSRFFKYTGAGLLGFLILSKTPFKFFQQKSPAKDSSIKISQNPNSVSRKSRKVNNA